MTAWPVKTLGEVCEVVNGATPDTKVKEYWGGSHAWITPAEMGNLDSPFLSTSRRTLSDEGLASCSAALVPPRTVILSSRAPIGYLAINEVPMATNQGCKSLIPREGLDFNFLYYYLKANVELLDSLGTGTTFKELSGMQLKTVEIPIPPLEEQKRIVALLDEATVRVTELTACYEQARTHANDLLESSLLELFADAFESQPKRRMGEVLQIARGGSPRPISEYITNSPEGVNWIKIGDASSSKKYIYETAQKIKPEGVSRSRMVYPGDFLLSNSMSFGRPYIMKTEGCIHDGWLVLRDSKGELDQDFLFYLLGSRFMYEKFSQLAAGSTVQNLNSALVSSVEIPVPPIDFQKKIAEKARMLEENVARLNEVNELRLQHANDLRQSILESAFAGEL
jgi:restriction endonuclease S subunit